ncbi:hypothetical protein ACFX2H_027539 [Malus domestica]
MPPRRAPPVPSETNFLNFGQLSKAIANAIQLTLRLPQRTTLEIVSHLLINNFFGNKGLKKSEVWIDHVENTSRVKQGQGNLPAEIWVETVTWFFRLGVESWWVQDSHPLSTQDALNWDVFRLLFEATFTPPEYKDKKKKTNSHS